MDISLHVVVHNDVLVLVLVPASIVLAIDTVVSNTAVRYSTVPYICSHLLLEYRYRYQYYQYRYCYSTGSTGPVGSYDVEEMEGFHILYAGSA